jgi:hypothetical protein
MKSVQQLPIVPLAAIAAHEESSVASALENSAFLLV